MQVELSLECSCQSILKRRKQICRALWQKLAASGCSQCLSYSDNIKLMWSYIRNLEHESQTNTVTYHFEPGAAQRTFETSGQMKDIRWPITTETKLVIVSITKSTSDKKTSRILKTLKNGSFLCKAVSQDLARQEPLCVFDFKDFVNF